MCWLFLLMFLLLFQWMDKSFCSLQQHWKLLTYDVSLLWRPNGHDGISNHQPHNCLLNHLFRCRSKKTLKLRVTGLCVGNSPVTSEFPAQMASNAENVSIYDVIMCNCQELQWCQTRFMMFKITSNLTCLFNSMFRGTLKKTSKPALLTLCEGNPSVTGGFPSQRANYAESISISWYHHGEYMKQIITAQCCCNSQYFQYPNNSHAINHQVQAMGCLLWVCWSHYNTLCNILS